MSRCSCVSGNCACLLEEFPGGDCVQVTITGTGSTENPYIISADPVIDPDPDNQLTCSPSGLLVTGGGGEVDVFVAAANTPAARQALANYVCDGTNDQVEIQAALDQLGTGLGAGGRVILMEGDFNVTAPIMMTFQVSLYGMGIDATSVTNTNDDYILVCFSGLSSEIANISLEGATGGGINTNGALNIHIHDMNIAIDTITGTLAGLFINDSSGMFENNIISTLDSDAVVAITTRGFTLIYNQISGGLILSDSPDVIVFGNTLEQDNNPVNSVLTGLGYAGYIGSAAFFTGVFNSVISYNIVQTARRHGIVVIDSGGYNTMHDNSMIVVSDEAFNTYDAIYLENTDGNTIQGSKIQTATARYSINIATASCDDNLVTNNDLLFGYTTAAINDAGTGTVTVAGNRV